jgi:hypothetical protein
MRRKLKSKAKVLPGYLTVLDVSSMHAGGAMKQSLYYKMIHIKEDFH